MSRPSFFNRIYTKLRFPYRSDILFSIVFFATVFVPLTQFPYLTDIAEAPKLILWLVCTAFGLWYIMQRPQTFRRPDGQVSFLILAYFFLTVISTFFSIDVYNSIFGLQGRFTSSIFFAALWGAWIFVLVTALDKDKIVFLFKSLTVVGLLIAVYGIIQQQGIAYYEGLNPQARSLAPSFLGNPNFSSMYLIGVLPLSAMAAYLSRTRISRYFYLISIFLMLWSVMSFSSRGAILGLAVSLVIFVVGLIFIKEKRKLFFGILLTALISVGLFIAFYSISRPDTINKTLNLQETTVNFRLLSWNDSFQLMENSPWFGTGAGNYFIGFKSLGDITLATGERFDDAHNIFLHIGATTGIPSLLVFIALIFVILFYLYKDLRKTGDPVSLAIAAAIFGLLVAMSFNPVTVACWLLLGVLIGAAVVHSSRTILAPMNIVGRAISGLIAGLFFVFALNSFLSSNALYNAITAYRNGDYKKAYSFSSISRKLIPFEQGAYEYEIASRTKLGMEESETLRLISELQEWHPASSDTMRRAKVAYFMLFNASDNKPHAEKIAEVMKKSEIYEPNYALLLGQNAYGFYLIGNYDEMVVRINRALTINDKDFYSWILLAKYYQIKNQQPQMLYALERAQKLNPDILLLKYFIAKVKESKEITKLDFPVRFPNITL